MLLLLRNFPALLVIAAFLLASQPIRGLAWTTSRGSKNLSRPQKRFCHSLVRTSLGVGDNFQDDDDDEAVRCNVLASSSVPNSSSGRRQWIRSVIGGTAAAVTAATTATNGMVVSPAFAANVISTQAVCDSSVSVWKKDGCIIYLLGTAHVSKASAALAGQLVRDTTPKGVFVELDPKRVGGTGILAQKIASTEGDGSIVPEKQSRVIVPSIQAADVTNPSVYTSSSNGLLASKDSTGSNSNSFPITSQPKQNDFLTKATSAAVGKSIKGMYKKLDSAGFESGEEFVVAIKEGRNVGADIILGDRDVDVTLRRVAEGLAKTDFTVLLSPDSELEQSLQELVPTNMQSKVNGGKGDLSDDQFKSEFSTFVETMKVKDNVRKIMGQLQRVAPYLYEALVSERDAYMAAGMNGLSNELETMVAVVGIAHVDGIEKNLQQNGWMAGNPTCSKSKLTSSSGRVMDRSESVGRPLEAAAAMVGFSKLDDIKKRIDLSPFQVPLPMERHSGVPSKANTRVQSQRTTTTRLQSSKMNDDTNVPGNGGEVGQGSNWIEKSFPVQTEEKIDIKKVEDYNLGISGKDLQTGQLSKRMYETMISRSSLDMSDEIKQAYKLYAMDFTAKEATRAALNQNGLQMTLQEEEEDQGMWGDIEAVRLYDVNTDQLVSSKQYDSLEDAVEDWTPGQTFDFVVRQVPAKVRQLSVDELMAALDPDGSLRREAKEAKGGGDDEDDEVTVDEEALLSIFDDVGIASLAELTNDCAERTRVAPTQVTDEKTSFAGFDSRGYRPINRSDLLQCCSDGDLEMRKTTIMHVMNALVSHGVLLVDITNGGTTFQDAEVLADMWKTTRGFFDAVSEQDVASSLPGMTTVMETGSRHAKVGYAAYDSDSMKFLETRRERTTDTLLPVEAANVVGPDGVKALLAAFDIVSKVGQDVVQVAVAAASVEHGAFLDDHQPSSESSQQSKASQAAALLAAELIDDGRPLKMIEDDSDGSAQMNDFTSVSMSPHRLCCYSDNQSNDGDVVSSREIFGAHTDSSFVTVVPVAAVSGLEVYDEDAERWYRPELKAKAHWEAEQLTLGKDHTSLQDTTDQGKSLPWHCRYLAIMPGEFLQLSTRDEVSSAVHRVVASRGGPERISAPILLRGRAQAKFDAQRYVGGSLGNPLLDDADGLTMEEIHDKCQSPPFQ